MSPESQRPALEGELDNLIFSNRKLDAIKLLRHERGLTLSAATEALTSRYRELRAGSPSRFTCGDEEYWHGFFS
jgi:hypothetical protein